MRYNPAVVGKLGLSFPLQPSMKASFIYDDQDKISHRFNTLGTGGLGDSFSHYRGDPHIRFA